MQFNSFIFILLFLPLAVAGYFTLNIFHNKAAQIYLLGMSLWFYGYFNPRYLAILCSSILFNYMFSQILGRKNAVGKKFVLIIAVLFNLGLIFYFKYYDFFIDSINRAFHTGFLLKNIMLPLGISFFTFQQLSYIVDSYRGKTRSYGIIEYALFVSFFPQLVAGPIVLHNELIPQFRDKSRQKINADNLVRGITLFVLGLSKKVLLADTLGGIVTWGYSNVDTAGSLDLILVSLAYTFQIYFDFSGYSDTAVGIASLFNFRLPMNFNSPYKSLDINDFWRRWHMTLTRFLRTYVYYPMGGNKKGLAREYFNILVVFLLSGIWHGADWTFVLWGALQGIACILHRMVEKIYSKIPAVFRWLITFVLIDILWILFRADSISQCMVILKKICTHSEMTVSPALYESASMPEISYLLNQTMPLVSEQYPWLFTAVLYLFSLVICLAFRNNYEREIKPTLFGMVITAFLFIWCLVSLGNISVFLYFNF